MRRDIPEVRDAGIIFGNAIAVIHDPQIRLVVLPATRNSDVAGMCINAVFDEFRNGFKRVRLRQRDDGDRVPVVADTQLAGLDFFLSLFAGSFSRHDQSALATPLGYSAGYISQQNQGRTASVLQTSPAGAGSYDRFLDQRDGDMK